MLPVGLKVRVMGLKISALRNEVPVNTCTAPSMPPAIRTIPLPSIVAVWKARPVARLPVETKPEVTASVVDPLIVPEVALIVVMPAPALEARPAALIVATDVAEELQVAIAVKSWVLLSEKVPVALNCCAVPSCIEGFVGVTAMEDNVGPGGAELPDPQPQAASAATWTQRSEAHA